jgi:hypothetical protein
MSVMTEALAQQEMFEAPPRRRIQTFGGADSWWGIDPSSRGISLAWIDHTGTRGVHTELFPRLTGGARASAIYATSRELARTVAATAPPGLIFVEQPSGAMVVHELEYAVGVILAAVYDGACAAGQPPPKVETITSSWWKKRACGHGGIRKPKRRSEPYGVLTWAALNGYTGSSWDESDAWAIAEAARREVALEAR